jgi:iron(III) transport system permease protein
LVVVLTIVAVPLANLCYKAGVVVQQVDSQRIRSWSAAKSLQMVLTSPWRFREEYAWSLAIAQLTAVSATLLAVPLAWRARAGGVRAAPGVLLAAAGLAVPAPLVALALIGCLNRPDVAWLAFLYDRTLLAPCAVLLVRSLPLAFLVMWYAMLAVPEDILQHAMTEGAGSLTRLRRIVLPQVGLGLITAWLIALAVSMGEVSATILVVPPGVTTLSVRIFNLVHYGVEDQLAGVCLSLVALYTLLAAVTMHLAAAWQATRQHRWQGPS